MSSQSLQRILLCLAGTMVFGCSSEREKCHRYYREEIRARPKAAARVFILYGEGRADDLIDLIFELHKDVTEEVVLDSTDVTSIGLKRLARFPKLRRVSLITQGKLRSSDIKNLLESKTLVSICSNSSDEDIVSLIRRSGYDKDCDNDYHLGAAFEPQREVNNPQR